VRRSLTRAQFNHVSLAVPQHWQNSFGVRQKEICNFTAKDFGEHHDLSIVHQARVEKFLSVTQPGTTQRWQICSQTPVGDSGEFLGRYREDSANHK
jgi:hypothetical protein